MPLLFTFMFRCGDDDYDCRFQAKDDAETVLEVEAIIIWLRRMDRTLKVEGHWLIRLISGLSGRSEGNGAIEASAVAKGRRSRKNGGYLRGQESIDIFGAINGCRKRRHARRSCHRGFYYFGMKSQQPTEKAY